MKKITIVLLMSLVSIQVSAKPLTYAHTTAVVYDTLGKVNDDIPVDGYHTMSVTNTTADSQTYYYNVTIECDGVKQRKSGYLFAPPGGIAYGSEQTKIYVKHPYPGNWRVDVTTEVYGGDYGSSTSHAVVRAKVN